jgi:hypothetical protein
VKTLNRAKQLQAAVGCAAAAKFQIPRTKLQRNFNPQIPKGKMRDLSFFGH